MKLAGRWGGLFWAAALLGGAPARAAVDLAWDCYLASGAVTCSELENAFFSNRAFARANADAADAADPHSPDASVHVRAIPTADGVNYSFDVHGKEGSSLTVTDRVPRGFSHDAVLLRLVGDLQKASSHLFALEEPGVAEDGALTLVLRDPDVGPRLARADDAQTGWYLAPSLSLNTDSFGVTELVARGGLEANWSHPAWRLHGWVFSSYRYVHVDDGSDDPEDTYQNFDIGTDWTVVRTLSGGFALGANPFVMRAPQENYAFRAGTLVGAEWMLRPFLKTDEGNFGARYEIGAEHQDYVYESVLGLNTHDFMRHRLRLFGAWHFSRLDLSGGVSAASVLNDLNYSSLSGNGAITWRILEALSVEVSGELSYRNALVNEPKDLSQIPPLAQFYGGGAFGTFTWWSWLSLRYVFGNSLLSTQDQRWR